VAPFVPLIVALIVAPLGARAQQDVPPAIEITLSRSAATSAALEADLLVEIPAGSSVKYEIDPETGDLRVDRFLPGALAYPANYGYLPGTCAGDGDALDALVLTRAPIDPGAIVRIRIVAMLRMVDGGEQDDKLVALPAAGVDDTGLGRRETLTEAEFERIERFFADYKRADDGRTPVELAGWAGVAEARTVLERARSDRSCH
jgi:inorganic pyrophosphatase